MRRCGTFAVRPLRPLAACIRSLCVSRRASPRLKRLHSRSWTMAELGPRGGRFMSSHRARAYLLFATARSHPTSQIDKGSVLLSMPVTKEVAVCACACVAFRDCRRSLHCFAFTSVRLVWYACERSRGDLSASAGPKQCWALFQRRHIHDVSRAFSRMSMLSPPRPMIRRSLRNCSFCRPFPRCNRTRTAPCTGER